MAEQVRIDITADDKASPKIDKVADKVDDLEKPVKIPVAADTTKAERDIADVLAKADKLASAPATLLLTSNAATIGREITDLVIELDKLDASDPTITAKSDQINTLTGDLDQIEAKIREINSTPVDIDTTSARTGVKDLGDRADSSRSVLANMVGNTTQDLGALGGVAGGAGVAIGQLGEYATEGNISLSNLAKVAGPMAGLAAAMQLVNEVMASRAASDKIAAQQQKLLTDAYVKGGDAATDYAEALNKAGKVEVGLDRNKTADEVGGLVGLFSKLSPLVTTGAEKLGLFGEATADLTPLLAEAGVSTDKWAAAVVGGNQLFGDFATGLSHTTLSADEQRTVMDALTDAQKDNGEAKRNAAVMETVFGDAVDGSTKSVEAAAEAADKAARDTAALELSTMLAEQAARDMDAAWSALSGKLDAEQAIANIGADFDAMREKGAVAWQETAAGTANAKTAQDDYAQSVRDAKDQVITLGKQIGLSVPEVKAMLLDIDDGDIDDVERKLAILTRNRTMNLSIITSGGPGYGGNPGTDTAPRSIAPEPAPVVYNTFNMPRGMRSDDVLAAADRHARRNGGTGRARR